MVETRAQVMANEKIERLEPRLDEFKDQLDNLAKALALFTNRMSGSHQEEHSIAEHLEGESSHHIHFHGNHQHSQSRPPKLDMYKFDVSNPAV